MKKAIVIAGCCLALSACGKDKTSMALPTGYQNEKFESFYSMRDCIRHAKQEVRSKNIKNVNESAPKDGVFVVSGTMDNSNSILYECSANPYPNATLTTAVKLPSANKHKA